MQIFNLFTIFVTGLFAGGITCIVLQGGLFTAVIAGEQGSSAARRIRPILLFLLSKLIAYTLLGFFLGWVGSLFTLSIPLQIFLQLLAILFMVITGINLVTNYVLLQKISLTTPEFVTHIFQRREREGHSLFLIVLGALTVFLPCGATQAMMALAVSSGKPLAGAEVLFAFILGTTPVFFFLGFATIRIRSLLKTRFAYIAAFGVFFLALINLNNVLALAGNGFTLQEFAGDVYCTFSICSLPPSLSPTDSQIISITEGGYLPGTFAVRAGSRVTLHLVNENASNCTQAFTIPRLGLQAIVPMGTEKDVSFAAPKEQGILSYMCSAGQYIGQIHVM